MRLLSVDWDFFFPLPEVDNEFLYDWGHRESLLFMLESIWDIRAAAFLRAGKQLPVTSGDDTNFWDRFSFLPDAALYYADSHSQIYKPEVSMGVSEIWNFDAHHDAYQKLSDVLKQDIVTCENWATVLYYVHGVKINVFYPSWAKWMMKDKPKAEITVQVDRGKRFNRVFDRVFLCRSGAWTPTWIEGDFWKFIDSCPIRSKLSLDPITKRVFTAQNAIDLNNQFASLIKEKERTNSNNEERR